MSPTTDIEQRLREAMDGVTPGPWAVEQSMSRKYLDAVLFQYQSGMKGTVALIGKETAQVGASELDEQNANSAYIALCSPDNIGALLDTIASLRSKLEEAERALEPFALVAEYDIGDSESDEDIFRPMDGRNSIAGLVRVGHLRAARRTLASLREADHA